MLALCSQDAPMRFFFRVRTNEPSLEDELPEVPLRRSPSISGRKSIKSPSAPPSDTETVNSDDSAPLSAFSTNTDFSSDATPVQPNLPPQPVKTFTKPESPATPSATTAVQNTPLQKLKLTITSSITPPSSPRSAADTKKVNETGAKSPKVKTPKTNDEKLAKIAARVAKKSSKEPKECKDEKRVENIKLKIDQNSVTIVKSTTKELKMRFKKDREQKETNAKVAAGLVSPVASTSASACVAINRNKGESSPKSKKSDIASIKLAKVPEQSDSISGPVKYEIKSPVVASTSAYNSPHLPIKMEVDFIKSEIEDSEEKKSEFLNSFQLTPTKSLSPEKLQQIDAQIRMNQQSPKLYAELKQTKSVSEQPKSPSTKRNSTSPPALATKPMSPKAEATPKVITKEVTKTSPPAHKSISFNQTIKSIPVQKRKNKDPVKNISAKKSRSNSPEELKSSTTLFNLPEITLNSIFTSTEKPVAIKQTPAINSKTESLDKQLMRPPVESGKPVKDVFAKPHPVTRPELTLTEKKNLSVKPIDKLMPKPLIVNNVQRPTQPDTPHPLAPTTKRPVANVSAKKLATIAPKPTSSTTMPPPMVPPLHLRNNSDTEIKQIKNDASTKDLKIYGPLMDKHPLAIKAPGSSSPAYVPSYPSIPIKQNGNSSGYLNYALHNSHKRASESQQGMRTPAYQSSASPSYSPNSPQFSPSYNISPFPQYKYMKPPSHLANFFPNPPKVIPANNSPPMKPQPEELNKRHVNENTLKRPHNTSPKNDKVSSPPEKQQKVQSLLDSCKITFPSSLSITLHEQKDPKSNQSMFQAMHKGPVNNYIEIVKLPDLPAVEEPKKCSSPTKKPLSPPTNSKSPIPIQPRPLPPQSPIQMTVTTSAPMQFPMAPPPVQSTKSPMTVEKKMLPDLQLIDRMTALKTSFQEKFIKSLDDPKAPKANNAGRQPKTATTKTVTSAIDTKAKPGTAPIIARRHSMATNAKDMVRPPIRIAPKQDTKKAPRSPIPTSPRPMPPIFATPNSVRPHKSDDALDLTSATTSASSSSSTSRVSPIHHNNNDHHLKKHSTEMLPPPPPPPTSSPSSVPKQSDMAIAAMFAAMARASQTSATFMTPQNLTASHLQHWQQQYMFDHLTRMQKVGQEQFAEVLANYTKAAAVVADAKAAAAAVADQGKMPPPKTSSSPKASSSSS